MNPLYKAVGIRKVSLDTDWAPVIRLGFDCYGDVDGVKSVEEFAKMDRFRQLETLDGFVREVDGQLTGVYLFCNIEEDPWWYQDGEPNPNTLAKISLLLEERGLEYPLPKDLQEVMTAVGMTDKEHWDDPEVPERDVMQATSLTMRVVEYAVGKGSNIVTSCWRGDGDLLSTVNLSAGFIPVCEVPDFYLNGDPTTIMIKALGRE